MATKDITVADIVTEYLKANGYDGLVDKYGECACVVPYLMPCCTSGATCKAGHEITSLDDECPDGFDFHIKAGKKE